MHYTIKRGLWIRIITCSFDSIENGVGNRLADPRRQWILFVMGLGFLGSISKCDRALRAVPSGVWNPYISFLLSYATSVDSIQQLHMPSSGAVSIMFSAQRRSRSPGTAFCLANNHDYGRGMVVDRAPFDFQQYPEPVRHPLMGILQGRDEYWFTVSEKRIQNTWSCTTCFILK